MVGNQSQASLSHQLHLLKGGGIPLCFITTATRTLRLTENKRRYRARRKEYVSDLEQRLAEARERGVQATKEVQLAAQQVMQENTRLRELLLLAGFSHEEIGAWAGSGSCSDGRGDNGCARRQECEKKARDYAAAQRNREGASEERETTGTAAAAQLPALPAATRPTKTLVNQEDTEDGTLPKSSQDETGTSQTPATGRGPPSRSEKSCPSAAPPSDNVSPRARTKLPCKLLSRLEENPGTDLTQIPLEPGPDAVPPTGKNGAGVECGKAYEMLMRFAISEEKMDTIAQALEEGCTPDGRGKCAVRQEAIWEVLDGMCG